MLSELIQSSGILLQIGNVLVLDLLFSLWLQVVWYNVMIMAGLKEPEVEPRASRCTWNGFTEHGSAKATVQKFVVEHSIIMVVWHE